MTLLEQLIKRGLPLDYIKNWSDHSFKFDAISILSILGSREVDLAVGTLTRRRYTECLPLLAGQVIASGSFASSQPGFTLYDLDHGIQVTELNASFTRILWSINTNKSTTILTWKPVEHGTKRVAFDRQIRSVILSFLTVAPLLVCTILMGDWYGVCNAGAIIVSILCRLHLVSQLRRHRDLVTRPTDSFPHNRVIQGMILRPDASMLTFIVPNTVLSWICRPAEVEHPHYYKMIRRLAWLALSIHLCTLNMCTLFSQIYTIVLLGLSTWVMNSNLDFDVGCTVLSTKDSDLYAEKVYRYAYSRDWDMYVTSPPRWQKDPDGGLHRKIDRRQVAWARLNLSEQQETMMQRWELLPLHENNKAWWETYSKLKDEFLTPLTPTVPPAPTPPRPPYTDTRSSPSVSIPLTQLSRSPNDALSPTGPQASSSSFEGSGNPVHADSR